MAEPPPYTPPECHHDPTQSLEKLQLCYGWFFCPLCYSPLETYSMTGLCVKRDCPSKEFCLLCLEDLGYCSRCHASSLALEIEVAPDELTHKHRMELRGRRESLIFYEADDFNYQIHFLPPDLTPEAQQIMQSTQEKSELEQLKFRTDALEYDMQCIKNRTKITNYDVSRLSNRFVVCTEALTDLKKHVSAVKSLIRSASTPELLLLTLMCVLSFMTPHTNASKIPVTPFYICSETLGAQLFSLPKLEECSQKYTYKVENSRADLWMPRTEPLLYEAYACTLHIRSIKTYTSVFMGEGIVDDSTSVKILSSDECRGIHQTKTWEGRSLTEKEPGFFVAAHNTAVAFVYCCKVRGPFQQKYMTLAYSHVATMDGQSVFSTLGNLAGCRFSEGMCINSQNTIIWELPSHTIFQSLICPYIFIGNYIIHKSDVKILIKSLQSAYVVDKDALIPECVSELDPVGTYSTAIFRNWTTVDNATPMEKKSVIDMMGRRVKRNVEEPDIKPDYVTSSNPTGDPLQTTPSVRPTGPKTFLLHILPQKPTPFHPDKNLSYFQDKADYQAHHIKLNYLAYSVNMNFHFFWETICMINNNHLRLVIELLKVEPNTAIRLLLGREGISARLASQAIAVFKCKEVYAQDIYYNHTLLPNQCWYDTPLLGNDSIMYFILGAGPYLALNSIQIDCQNQHVMGAYQEESIWYDPEGNKIHVQKIPSSWKIKRELNSFLFTTPNIVRSYPPKFATSLALLPELYTRLFRLEDSHDRLTNFSIKFSTDPDTIRSIIAGTGEAAGNILHGAGLMLGAVFQGAGKGVASAADGLVTGTTQLILNLVIIVSVVAVVGLTILLVVYLGFKGKLPCLNRLHSNMKNLYQRKKKNWLATREKGEAFELTERNITERQDFSIPETNLNGAIEPQDGTNVNVQTDENANLLEPQNVPPVPVFHENEVAVVIHPLEPEVRIIEGTVVVPPTTQTIK
jgi:hypothetical protein